jgi:hypothetical protein
VAIFIARGNSSGLRRKFCRRRRVEGSAGMGLLCRWGANTPQTSGKRSLSILWGRCTLEGCRYSCWYGSRGFGSLSRFT